jgi:hypothetical protein
MKILSNKEWFDIQNKLRELERLEDEMRVIYMYCGSEFPQIKRCLRRLFDFQKEIGIRLRIEDWRQNMRMKFKKSKQNGK